MAPNVKLHFFAADDINGDVLHEITDEDNYFKKLTLKLERDGLGGAELILARNVSFAGFGSGTFQPEVFVRLVIAAYSDTIYYPWGFFLDKRQQTVVHVEESGAEEFHFGGPGPKMYLDRSALGIEQLTGATFWNLDLENGIWRWGETATVGRVLNRIYQEDQARDDPALPDLTLGFDAADDSDGNPWTDDDLGGPDQFELPIGHSLLDSLWDIDDVVELTAWIELGTVAAPIFELNVSEGLGLDKTGSAVGAGVCLLREGLNIANKALTTEGHSLKKASHVIVEGKDGNWVEVARPTFTSGDYVKIAKITYSRQNSDFWLEKAGLRWLQRQDYGEKELTVEILPGNSDATGYYFPAPNRNLWLSHLISVDTSADGMTHSPLDIQPSEDQLVTGLLLETHQASDDSSATAKTRSWDVSVVLNRERPGNVQKTPDQRSAASGGGDCKCIKLCPTTAIIVESSVAWKTRNTGTYPAGWKLAGFDDSVDPNAGLVGSTGIFYDDGSPRWIRHPDGIAAARIFREEFTLTEIPTSASLGFTCDNAGEVFINGTSVATRADALWGSLGTFSVSPSLFVVGTNCISANYTSDGFNPQGIYAVLTLESGELTGGEGNAARCDHGHLIETLNTTETDTALRLAPDGAGGVEFAVGGGGAPTTADYLVGTAQGGLSAEIVVGTTPGGELGGTWASPTVDAIHSGSTHDAATNTHIADATDAHDASAISIADAGGLYTGTEVEAALQEIGAHPGDTSDAHDASAVSVLDTGGFYTGTDVEAALAQIGAAGGAGGASTVVAAYAACSGNLTLTTAMQDIAGATITASPSTTEVWMVTAAVDFKWTTLAAGNFALCELQLDGATQPGVAVLQGNTVHEATVIQQWVLTGISAASHTVKLRAMKTGAGGVALAQTPSTTLTVLRIA